MGLGTCVCVCVFALTLPTRPYLSKHGTDKQEHQGCTVMTLAGVTKPRLDPTFPLTTHPWRAENMMEGQSKNVTKEGERERHGVVCVNLYLRC